MGRENVNINYKFGDSDAFMLTDLDTDQSLMLIPCDTAGNFSWTGVTRAPLERNAMQTSNTSNQYSDLQRPWISIPQENWSGGRGNATFTKDTTRYYDGKRAQAAFNEVIYNGPLDYYSDGISRAVSTNCPGSLYWEKVAGGKKVIVVKFTCGANTSAGEIYIHLRRRGTPKSPLYVDLCTSMTSSSVLATHTYNCSEITDTLAEFKKFTFDAVTLTQGSTYYIRVHCESSTNVDYWQVGCSKKAESNTFISSSGSNFTTADFEMYYRIASPQTDYRSKFFMYEQLMFAVRQQGENGAPVLLMNGEIGKSTGTTSTTITDSAKAWTANQWKGARVGIVYKNGSQEHVDCWRTIVSNTATAITVDSDFGITPSTGCIYIINDTPIWQTITGHGLTAHVTDVHVINGVVYFAQGDYVNARKMRWHDGAFAFMELTGITATFFQSVRDSKCMMLYRARNDGINNKRTVERSVLLDWETAATSWTSITSALTTADSDTQTVTEVTNGSTVTTTTNIAGTNVKKVTVSDSGGTKTTTTEILAQVPPLNISTTTESKDFGTCDYDSKQYVITITTLTSDNNTGSCLITLQESEDGNAWENVQSVNATTAGTYRIFAHCQYQYRRFMLTAVGTNTTVNTIAITTSQTPHFEDPVILQDNYGKITRLFEYGAEMQKSLWIAQEGMISSINKTDSSQDTYTHDRINMDELQTTAEQWNAKAMTTVDVYLAWGWLNGLQRYYNTQIEGKGPDHDEGLPFDRQGRVSQIVAYPSNFFISIDAEDGYSSVMQFNQSGWHEIYRAPNAGERIHDMGFQPIYGNRPDRLWINVGDDIIWLAMPSKILYAIQDRNAEYTHESVLVSAWHTAGMTDIEKLWQTLKIMADYLDGVNCWIEADYQTDEETVWHPIDSWYTVSPSQKEDLNPDGSVNGKKLRYRLRLQTTDMKKTPKVNVVVLEAVGRVDIKMSYNFYFRNIKYKRDLTAEFEDIEPFDVQAVLDEWANKIKKLRLNSRWKIFDDKLVYLDAVQTSVLNELSEGYIGQITLNEL